MNLKIPETGGCGKEWRLYRGSGGPKKKMSFAKKGELHQLKFDRGIEEATSKDKFPQ